MKNLVASWSKHNKTTLQISFGTSNVRSSTAASDMKPHNNNSKPLSGPFQFSGHVSKVNVSQYELITVHLT